MFLNVLYSIKDKKEAGDGKFIYEVEINPAHAIFSGHFPGNPVLPGACTVQIMKELLEDALSEPLQMTKANVIKYLSFINPEINRTIFFSVLYKSEAEGAVSCQSTAYFENINFCSFKGEFTKTE